MLGLFGLLAAAFAGDADLELERGRVALERQEYQAARDRAVSALGDAPGLAGAHQLYVDATTGAGLGSRGLYELIGLETEDPPGTQERNALTEAVTAHDWRMIRDLTERVLFTYPTAPDLLQPLWDSTDAKVVKLRSRVVRALITPEALTAADVEGLYRLRRLLLEVGDDEHRAVVDAALVAEGEDKPPPRAPLTRMEQMDAALQLSKEPVPALPWAYPSEQVQIVGRLGEIWLKAGRFRHLALAWQQVQRDSDDPMAWTGEAEAWLAGKENDKALVAASSAVLRSTHPRNVDLVALNEDRQRQDLAQALLVKARAEEAAGDPVSARADLALGQVLSESTLDPKLAERLDKVNTLELRARETRYPTSRGTAAEAAIAAAASSKDPAVVQAAVTDALVLSTIGTSGGKLLAEQAELFVDLFGRAQMALAESENEAGRIDQARAAAVIATLLTGRSHPWWWATRGQLQERNGEYDAAFASYAIARGLGVPELDEALARTYVGIADWEVAANTIGGMPPATVAAKEPLVAARPAGPARRKPGERPATAPRLEEPFPSFILESDYGQLSLAALKGRVVVLTFWDSDCGECLQMLPAFGSLARRLRKEGRDMVVIGISSDEEKASFDKVFRLGQRWCDLVHAPTLAEKFGITRVPTTWVIDRTGVARYFVDHWLSAEELESYVRQVE